MTCQPDERGDQGGVAEVDNARRATKSLKRTVSLGLLTGRFAIPGDDEIPGEREAQPNSEATIAPVVEAGELGTATRGLLSELRRAEATIRPPDERPTDSGTTHDPQSIPRPDVASSLIGKADIRYYREVARLGAQVADALAYAHQRGVLHRDIKPSNLMLDAAGERLGHRLRPGQVRGGRRPVAVAGPGRDLAVHGPRAVPGHLGPPRRRLRLGATLYELLTLRPPFEGNDQLQLIQRIENEPPVPPRQLDRRIPRDLETIVLKALAKDPSDRFADAEADGRRAAAVSRGPADPLATDSVLPAVLAMVQAEPLAGRGQHHRRGADDDSRHRFDRRGLHLPRQEPAGRPGQSADPERESETREQLFEALQAQARAGRFSRQMGQRFDGLDALAKAAGIARDLKLPRERFDALRDEAIACLALPDLKPTGRVITLPARRRSLFAFDSTMTRYALRFRDGTIQVRRVADDQEIARFQARGDREIFVFGFSPDGRYLATTHFPGGALTVWDIDRAHSRP